MDYRKARPGQELAISTLIQRIENGEQSTSIILPTGYGKSDVIRASAIYLHREGLIATSLIIVPNDNLRGQAVKREDVVTTCTRYCLPWDIKYSSIPQIGLNYGVNGECILSTTIQLVQQNVSHFVLWVQSVVHKTGKPVIVYVDEVHTHTTMNEWGKTIKALQRAGAHIVVLTATPYREDGASIVGFELHREQSEPISITRTRRGSAPEKVLVQIWEGTRYYYSLKADVEVTFRQAWEENALCHISRHEFDARISIIDGNNETQDMLSDLDERNVRRVLGKLVRHPEAIRNGCNLFVARLRDVKLAGPAFHNCAGIIFTANDEAGSKNEHAEAIKSVIKAMAPELKIVIATSADDDNGKKTGKAVLERFRDNDEGDVLIVKQMAGLGLDVPRIKVCLDLSPVRSPTSLIQRINRATRPYNNMLIAHYITPADCLSRACFAQLIEAQGGAHASELDLAREYEKDREDGSTPALIMINEAAIGDMSDSLQKTATRDDLPFILNVLEAFPMVLQSMTFPQIAERARMLNFQPNTFSSDNGPVDTGSQADPLRKECNYKANILTRLRFLKKFNRSYQQKPGDSAAYGALSADVWTEAKHKAEIDPAVSIKKLVDVSSLERLRAALDYMSDQEVK